MDSRECYDQLAKCQRMQECNLSFHSMNNLPKGKGKIFLKPCNREDKNKCMERNNYPQQSLN